MKPGTSLLRAGLPTALALALTSAAHAGLLTNGGFESGFSGWSIADQPGSEGGYAIQSGTLSPVNGETVPAPPAGTYAAMTDAMGPGSHVLYQDFVVPASVADAKLKFSLYVNNSLAGDFRTPATLDFATTALNQQARVDIVPTSADLFSVAPTDILQNAFRTLTTDPQVSGYTDYEVDITSLLQSYAGQTLRLRFAEVDNIAPLMFGIDNVSIDLPGVPDGGSPVLLLAAGLGAIGVLGRRNRSLPRGF
jgi:hypothetical protein